MAPEARVWDKLDFEADWRRLEAGIANINDAAWDAVVGRRTRLTQTKWRFWSFA